MSELIRENRQLRADNVKLGNWLRYLQDWMLNPMKEWLDKFLVSASMTSEPIGSGGTSPLHEALIHDSEWGQTLFLIRLESAIPSALGNRFDALVHFFGEDKPRLIEMETGADHVDRPFRREIDFAFRRKLLMPIHDEDAGLGPDKKFPIKLYPIKSEVTHPASTRQSAHATAASSLETREFGELGIVKTMFEKDPAYPDPTTEDLLSPLFEAIWRAIKGWDLKRKPDSTGYAGATGNDVMHILAQVRHVLPLQLGGKGAASTSITASLEATRLAQATEADAVRAATEQLGRQLQAQAQSIIAQRALIDLQQKWHDERSGFYSELCEACDLEDGYGPHEILKRIRHFKSRGVAAAPAPRLETWMEQFEHAQALDRLRRERERKSTGVLMIAKERYRQIDEQGFTHEHDDHEAAAPLGGIFTLLKAAYCYAFFVMENDREQRQTGQPRPLHWEAHPSPRYWPWQWDMWKPSADPIRNLEKAGALIAAQIDLLLRRKAFMEGPQAGPVLAEIEIDGLIGSEEDTEINREALTRLAEALSAQGYKAADKALIYAWRKISEAQGIGWLDPDDIATDRVGELLFLKLTALRDAAARKLPDHTPPHLLDPDPRGGDSGGNVGA